MEESQEETKPKEDWSTVRVLGVMILIKGGRASIAYHNGGRDAAMRDLENPLDYFGLGPYRKGRVIEVGKRVAGDSISVQPAVPKPEVKENALVRAWHFCGLLLLPIMVCAFFYLLVKKLLRKWRRARKSAEA